MTLRLVNAGEVMGLSSVIANAPYSTKAEILVPSEVSFFPRRQFLRFLSAHAEVSMRVAEALSLELHRAWEQARLLGLTPSARSKLAQLLLLLARQGGHATSQGTQVAVNMTHQEIGESIGASRETVSRLLAVLKRQGLILVKASSVILLQPDKLREASEG